MTPLLVHLLKPAAATSLVTVELRQGDQRTPDVYYMTKKASPAEEGWEDKEEVEEHVDVWYEHMVDVCSAQTSEASATTSVTDRRKEPRRTEPRRTERRPGVQGTRPVARESDQDGGTTMLERKSTEDKIEQEIVVRAAKSPIEEIPKERGDRTSVSTSVRKRETAAIRQETRKVTGRESVKDVALVLAAEEGNRLPDAELSDQPAPEARASPEVRPSKPASRHVQVKPAGQEEKRRETTSKPGVSDRPEAKPVDQDAGRAEAPVKPVKERQLAEQRPSAVPGDRKTPEEIQLKTSRPEAYAAKPGSESLDKDWPPSVRPPGGAEKEGEISAEDKIPIKPSELEKEPIPPKTGSKGTEIRPQCHLHPGLHRCSVLSVIHHRPHLTPFCLCFIFITAFMFCSVVSSSSSFFTFLLSFLKY